jgi:hypothetical protein
MNRIMLVAVVSVLSTSLVPAPARAAKGDTKARLASGEIIVTTKKVAGSSVPWSRAMGVVDAPPDKIWRVIERCDDYEKTMIRTAKAEELSRKGNKVRCRVTIDMPFPLSDLTAVTDAIHTVVPGKKYKRAWSLVEGDYDKNEGSWTLIPFDATGQRTLVSYEVHAEPKVPVPEGIQRAAQKKSLPKLIENLRAQSR